MNGDSFRAGGSLDDFMIGFSFGFGRDVLENVYRRFRAAWRSMYPRQSIEYNDNLSPLQPDL